jgi:hypothetical protein
MVVDAEERTVRFADGSTLEVGVVIWATGFRDDYSWIHVPAWWRTAGWSTGAASPTCPACTSSA